MSIWDNDNKYSIDNKYHFGPDYLDKSNFKNLISSLQEVSLKIKELRLRIKELSNKATLSDFYKSDICMDGNVIPEFYKQKEVSRHDGDEKVSYKYEYDYEEWYE